MTIRFSCKWLLNLLILVFIFFAYSKLEAQESLRFKQFSNENGFNQNSVNTITQDKYGFLWIGTPNGIIKYDGYDFEEYDGKLFSSNSITHLYNDANGLLWIGTEKGLDLYIPWLEKFKSIRLDSPINIKNIIADSKGRVWVYGDNRIYVCQIKLLANDVTISVSENLLEPYNSQLKTVNITNFLIENSNTVIFSTTNGLAKLAIAKTTNENDIKASNFYLFPIETPLINTIKKINNVYWLGTNKGLIKVTLDGKKAYINQQFKNFNSKNKVPNIILSMLEDSNGNVWIGTYNSGLFFYNAKNDTFTQYNKNPKNNNSVSSSIINCIYQDSYNILWFGTAQGGLNKLDLLQKPFYNYSNNPYDDSSIPDNLITSVLEDKNGKVWVATFNESLCVSKESIDNTNKNQLTFTRLQNKFPTLNNVIVKYIFEDYKGYIWLGTDYGVYVINPKNTSVKKIQLNIQNNFSCFYITQLNDNEIVLGGNNILVLKNPWNKIKNQIVPKINTKAFYELESNSVRSLLKIDDSNFWAGTKKGLINFKLNNNNIKILNTYVNIEDENSLSHNDVYSLLKDADNNLWAGTYTGGLNKIELNNTNQPVNFKYYNKKNILPDDAVYGILKEDKKYIWLSTDKGLCRLNEKNDEISIFDYRDGLPSNNFRKSAFHKGKSGYHYYGSLNGLTIFKPQNILLDTIPPKILISELRINNDKVNISGYSNSILNKSISETESITLNPDNKIISFDILAEQNSTPEKNMIAYKLEGFNNDWVIKKAGKTTVSFTNLTSGTYNLIIKGANKDGSWNINTTNLKITILPPWYFKWWSIILIAILLILIFYTIFNYLIRLEKLKQKLKFEQLDKERIHQIDQTKLRFFTNMSHEFKTPLTLIIGPLEKIMELTNNQETQKYYSIIRNNISRLQRVLEQVISYRKAETGHLKLKYSKTTLGDFTYPLLEAFEESVKKDNVGFYYKVNNPNQEIIIDIQKVEHIILNLSSNAIKFTKDTVSINTGIVVSDNKEEFYFEITDNGEGIKPDNVGKIFDRFYRGDIDKESGTGIGLALSKSLTDLMNGTIIVDTKNKTTFKLSIPLISKKDVVLTDKIVKKPLLVKNISPIISENDIELTEESETDSKPTLLIIDDEKDIRLFLKNAFKTKYNVMLAVNGAEGLKKLNKTNPVLIICDVMMPQMNGYEFCEKVKNDTETSHIPIILLTALNEESKKIEGIENGADTYITKPFSIKHLETQVKKLIENREKVVAYFSKGITKPKEDLNLPTKDRRFLNKINTILEENISNSNFGVEELASKIFMSTSTFYRTLKQLTGQAPNAFIRNFRIQKAGEILKSKPHLNSLQVMSEIGIESPSHYSTSFKKLHGVSHTDFIKKILAK